MSAHARALLASEGDTAAPTVKRFSPADASGNVSLKKNIDIIFDERISRGSGTITLRKESGEIVETFDVATSSRVRIRDKTLSINPTEDFEAGTRYQVSIDAGVVKDQSGNDYAGTTKYDFRTKLDSKAPSITAFYPRDGAKNISPSADISVVFSEDITRGKGSILLQDATGKTVETFKASSSRVAVSGNVLTIDPTAKLDLNQKYKVVFSAGSVKDAAGNNFKGKSGYDFRTSAQDIPFVPPTIPESGGGGSGGGGGGGTVSNFNIELNYTGDPTYQSYFTSAKAVWESIIIGDLPDIGNIDDLQITAQVNAIDGAGGILGQASPTVLRTGSNLPVQGTMTFDSADMATMAASGTLSRVILHEMGHVLGIGTLWATFGFNSNFGQYSGSNALNAYKAISGGNPAATFVPLETTSGSPGTDNVHWSESVFDTELMTGFAENNGNMPLSIITVQALHDLGYQVNTSAAEAYSV